MRLWNPPDLGYWTDVRFLVAQCLKDKPYVKEDGIVSYGPSMNIQLIGKSLANGRYLTLGRTVVGYTRILAGGEKVTGSDPITLKINRLPPYQSGDALYYFSAALRSERRPRIGILSIKCMLLYVD